MRNLNYFLKKWFKIPKNIYLCFRFPFLYPRNRWTGKHYNNWTLHNKHCDLYKKYHVLITKPNSLETFSNNKNIYYLNKVTESEWCEYWTNWWAKPLVKAIDFINNYVLQVFHCLPTYTELDAMPNGWRRAFGIQMCKEIKNVLLEDGGRKFLRKYRIMQIKEKNGYLHWYDAFTTYKIQKIIYKYAYISQRTCIICGNLATGHTPYEYYESPYCDKCKPKDSKYFIEYGVDEDNSWYGISSCNINGRTKEEFEKAKSSYKEYLDLLQ